jgi:hypothetical protein
MIQINREKGERKNMYTIKREHKRKKGRVRKWEQTEDHLGIVAMVVLSYLVPPLHQHLDRK